MTDAAAELHDPRFVAAYKLIGRTGARTVQVRYSEGDDPAEDKLVWMAVVEYADGVWDVAAGRDPLQAIFRMCDTLVDGGMCAACGRPTGFDPVTPLDDPNLP